MRRLCGVPLGKILYGDIPVCSLYLVYIVLKAVIVHNVGGYFSTPAYFVIYRIVAPICTFLALISSLLVLRRGMREEKKVYFQIHIAIRLVVGAVAYSTAFWLFISAYLPNSQVPPYHKVIQTCILGGGFGMYCFHLWVVKIYMSEVCGSEGIGGGGGWDHKEGEDVDLLRLDSVLGSGQFSKVVLGECEGKAVAIKVWQKQSYPDFTNNLLAELKLIASVKKHPNLVKFYGVTFLHEYCGIVLEHCVNGSLQSYLLKLKEDVKDEGTIYWTKKDLVRLATEITSGIQHLASIHIVHGDLAARNVLLTRNNSAKIADFGTSLRLYYYQLYATSGHSIFPWRWMPPEALVDLRFSVQSDVWSYGVLLWEMFSLGQVPYDNVAWSSDFAQLLIGGLRLGIPEFADKQLYDLMDSCWQLQPSHRISLEEILIQLNKLND